MVCSSSLHTHPKMTENNADSVIETGRLCIHIQLGCQPYAVHKVVSDKPDGVMRHIQSYRYTTDVNLISDEQRLKMYRTYEKSSGKSSSSFPGQLIPASVFTTKGLLSTINGWQEDIGETKESNSSDAVGKKTKRTYQHWETQANRISESMMRLVAPADIDRQTDHLGKQRGNANDEHHGDSRTNEDNNHNENDVIMDHNHSVDDVNMVPDFEQIARTVDEMEENVNYDLSLSYR